MRSTFPLTLASRHTALLLRRMLRFCLLTVAHILAVRAQLLVSAHDITKAHALSLQRWPSVAAAGGATKARMCPNGWGDRVLSMLAFATLQHLDGATQLLLYWPENERVGGAFTAVNNYSRVKHHFVLHHRMRITTDWNSFVEEPAFWYNYDGPRSQDLLPSALGRTFNRSIVDVRRAYAHVCTHLMRPSATLRRILLRLPENFTGLHVRRGDKVRHSTQPRSPTPTSHILPVWCRQLNCS